MEECKDLIQLSYRYAGWMFVTLLYAFQIFEAVHNVKKMCSGWQGWEEPS